MLASYYSDVLGSDVSAAQVQNGENMSASS